jgi:hypothetical protein
VWTSYDDFSGHGFKGAGRFYRSTDGAWQSAPCEQSQVADPQAGPQPGPTCGAWQPVDRAQWPTLEKLRGSTDVICSKQADTCRELGL